MRLTRLANALQRACLIDQIELVRCRNALHEARLVRNSTLDLVTGCEFPDATWLAVRLGGNRRSEKAVDQARSAVADQELRFKRLSADCARVERLSNDARRKADGIIEAEALCDIVELFVARAARPAQG